MSTMKDSIIVFKEGAKANFSVFGHLVPIFAGELDGEPRIFPVSWSNVQQKEEFANQVKQWIADGRLKEYIMVAEAWAVEVPQGEESSVREWLTKHGTLKDWPLRKEIVTVLYASPTEEIEYTADIIRGIMTHAMIGEWKQTQRSVRFNYEDFSTRFQGLFLKGKTGLN